MLKKVTLIGLGLLLAFPVMVDAQRPDGQRERPDRAARPAGAGGLAALLTMNESEVEQLLATVEKYRPKFAPLQERAAAAETREARMEVRREQFQVMQDFQAELVELGLVREQPARVRGEGRPDGRRGAGEGRGRRGSDN